ANPPLSEILPFYTYLFSGDVSPSPCLDVTISMGSLIGLVGWLSGLKLLGQSAGLALPARIWGINGCRLSAALWVPSLYSVINGHKCSLWGKSDLMWEMIVCGAFRRISMHPRSYVDTWRWQIIPHQLPLKCGQSWASFVRTSFS
ncbi:hypothetical protein, partial [Bartonella sp. AC134YNZD]|uniref:hypothetical protein n=1 Tax=Bartonella sp. AC134YNZD TaxID=3243446 RepID=UPI0035D0BEBD